jgi:hypothetical protein
MSVKTYYVNNLLGKKVFGSSIFFLGFYCLFFLNAASISFGITCIYVGLLILPVRGIDISIKEEKLKEFVSFFGIKLGTWKNIKNPDYISVFKASYYDEDGSKNDFINVNLFFKNNRHMTVYQTGNPKSAFEIAAFFKESLKIEILDATLKESKWLESQ